MNHWYFAKVITDAETFTISGLNVWDYHWKILSTNHEVIDPIYKSKYLFDEYEIENNGTKVNFIAGEFSNTVWGFYVKDLSLLSEAASRP
ncbi:hypothetical protein [uncultured Chryseobacterium sp.]|uniref:hypothetical protein n=1 Tax=uncultured Chryseobacterium sp. TaxID=259322 RepID=UPI0026046E3F|nr:hypothetical protein [uncultured Chryseobacterium sp.]